jgi:hypothetical protein
MKEKKLQAITLGELPLGLFDQATQFIASYSTVLVRNGDIAGSATYVKCGNQHGILTAHHVAFQCSPPFDFSPNSSDKLGFGIARMPHVPHAFEIEMQHLIPHEIGRPVTDDFGPDLLFIEIPASEPRLHTILAKRQFWNISITPDDRIEECYTEINCVWSTAGHPHALRKQETPSHGFSEVLAFPGLVGITGVEAMHERDGFDYFDTFADYTGRNDIPRSFQGESGGGLWRLPISKAKASDPHDTIHVGAPVLAGVLFYQGLPGNNRRLIRSHGPKSIYGVFRKKMNG